MPIETLLSRLYHWEKSSPKVVHFVQPHSGGQVDELTWAQIMDQVRRVAAHLESLQLPPRSQIALMASNSAYWMMADWAIMMAGHVSVPIYPTMKGESVSYVLEHSESKLLFVGKVDDRSDVDAAVSPGLAVIELPFAESRGAVTWQDIVAGTQPKAGEPDRDLDQLVTILYTSGSTGRPKGVMHNFRGFHAGGTAFVEGYGGLSPQDRMISYLPLAHAMERIAVEAPTTYARCAARLAPGSWPESAGGLWNERRFRRVPWHSTR